MGSKRKDHIRYRLYEILEVRTSVDRAARIYDFIYFITILLNLTVSIMYTYEKYRLRYGETLLLAEQITVGIFCIDYILRLYTAKYMYPESNQPRAIRKYILSFTGITDLLSFCPTICRSSFRRALWRSACCGSCVYSACSASTRITIRSG